MGSLQTPLGFELIIDIGIIVALIAVIISIISVILAYKKQKISMLHDLVLIRFKTYKKIKDEPKNKRGERIGNFLEYLSILVLKKIVNQKVSKELFLDDFKIFFMNYKNLINKNKSWISLHNLKQKWDI